MYRRVQDLSGRGAERHDPHMAARITHARIRARRERLRAERLAHKDARTRGGGGARCYSLSRPQCGSYDEVPVNGSCIHPAADHLSAKEATTICGKRLPRRNPCWQERGNVSCLPAILLLGEMRSGTTTLYSLLGSQPSIVLPAHKEPRYLTLPNYRHHTGSWYASNFGSAVSAPDRLTIDASPTMFNSPLIAPSWIAKWLPSSKLVVLLREPAQRTYSHWRTGVSWLRSSPCFRIPPQSANASTARAAAAAAAAATSKGEVGDILSRGAVAGVPAPIPEIRMMREVFSFEAVARMGIMEVVVRECGAHSGWAKEGGVMRLSNRSKACILESHVGETVAGLWHARQALASKRTAAERAAYVDGMRRVSVCSEFMLRSGAGVWRSSRYADNLEAWRKHFSASQLKVLATEAMERDPAATLNEVLSFVGLPKSATSPKPARYCLNGRHGVIVDSGSRAWHAGRLDGSSEGGAGGGVEECEAAEDKVRGPDGVRRYKIDAATEDLLKQFFAPYNERLFKMLGRRLEW